jgi:hypothetical protein
MRSTTLIGILALAASATAQNWCPVGAEWTFNYWHLNWQTGESHTGTLLARYTGDTLVGGQVAKRIEQSLHYEVVGTGETFLYNWGPTFTRYDDEVVYTWSSWAQQYDTLIWYGAAPGDNWTDPGPGHQYVVLDTATVEIGGLNLRRLEVQPQLMGEQIGPNNFIYERIGFDEFHTFNPGGFLADGVHFYFRCYRDGDISFPNPGPEDCGFTVGMPEKRSIHSPINLHPNPGTTFQFTGLGDRPALLRLLDMQGRVVREGTMASEDQPMDTGDLRTGCYLVEILLADGRREVLRWVRE